MLIHRIATPLVTVPETGRGCGPYNAHRLAEQADAINFMVRDHLREVASKVCDLDSSHTPPPFVDGIYGFDVRHQSVFTSVEQARNWFRAGVEEMKAAGFFWLTYEIKEKHVMIGSRQAAANLRRARLISIEEIPFEDDSEYDYCTWCGYGCTCNDDNYWGDDNDNDSPCTVCWRYDCACP